MIIEINNKITPPPKFTNAMVVTVVYMHGDADQYTTEQTKYTATTPMFHVGIQIERRKEFEASFTGLMYLQKTGYDYMEADDLEQGLQTLLGDDFDSFSDNYLVRDRSYRSQYAKVQSVTISYFDNFGTEFDVTIKN